ncbi:MAG: EpsG family protein [Oscillospiraceae bacterium]|nr:EpsG family protein [Oscillospiraceae bacterium]
MVYILLPPILLLSGMILCRERFGKVGRGIYCALFGILMFVVEGMRYNVGTDYKAYRRIFESLITKELGEFGTDRLEKGYTVTLKILSDGYDDFRIMFALIALVYAVAISIWIYRNSVRPEVSGTAFVMYGMMFYSMNFLRQYTSAVIVLYSFEYIKKKDFLRYLAMVLFAACFHWSALIMIPMYFILQIRIQPIVLTLYFVITGLVMVYSWDLIHFCIDFFEKTGVMFGTLKGELTGREISYGIYMFYFFGYALVFALMFIFRKRIYESKHENAIYLACMFFLVALEFIGIKHAIVSRFGLFFVMPAILGILPETVNAAIGFADDHFKQKKLMRFIVFVFFLGIASVFYAQMIQVGSNGCFPYKIWILK